MDADTSVQAELFIPAELPEFTKQDDLSATLDPPDIYKTTIHCGIQNGITRRDAIILLFAMGVLTSTVFYCMNYLKNIRKPHTRKSTLSNDNSRMPRPTQTPSSPVRGESSKRRRDLQDVLWRGGKER